MYLIGIDPTAVTTDAGFALGTIGFDEVGKGYQYARANGALAAGTVVQIDETGDATPVTLTTTAPGTGAGLPAGVALGTVADNEFCWIQRVGTVAVINVATAAAVHTSLNSTASAGRLDDDATSGAEVINGITTTAAEATNAAAGILVWPMVGRTV